MMISEQEAMRRDNAILKRAVRAAQVDLANLGKANKRRLRIILWAADVVAITKQDTNENG